MQERDIFLAALEIEDPAARREHVKKACDDDAELQARVESLLASHEGQSRFLNTPAVEQIADAAAESTDPTVKLDEEPTAGEPGRAATIAAKKPGDVTDQHDNPEDVPIDFLEPATRPDSLGRLGHYEILEIIGSGAFGIVLKAFDEKLQRVVAIKVLSPAMAATSPARKRFLREARSSAAVRHENVVAIYAVEDEPLPYLVMEYIPGQTLQERLDEHGPLDLPDVLRIGKQIADGLAAAHSQELIHRDIKPGNILLETSIDDHVKITDFGLARTVDDATMTQSGMIAGTPLYMAPEQALGQKLDTRADLFSLGSVLYQMISGRPPFRAPSTVAVLKRVAEETPRPIQEIIPEVPDWMCELIGHLHAKNPAERYATAKEVSDLLAKCLADLEAGRKPTIPAPTPPVAHFETENTKAEPGRVAPDRGGTSRLSLGSKWTQAAAVVLLLFVGLGITEGTGVTRITSTVIRIATGSGTLVIEANDPNVTVSIDGEDITIRGGGVKELTLKPGRYTVTATKDGKPVKRELVTITRNGETVVTIGYEPDKSATKALGKKAPEVRPFQWPKDAPPPAIAPFNAEQANQHQQAWAKYLGVPVEKEIVLGRDKAGKEVKLTMVLIPPGEFLMGTSEGEMSRFLERTADKTAADRIPGEGPQHRVRITRPFWLSRHELTRGQFRRFVEATQYKTDAERDGKGGWGLLDGKPKQAPQFVWNADVGFPLTEDHPVLNVSWNDAAAFCRWLSKQQQGLKFHLPTEAQWEYACRAGTTTAWHTGDSERDVKQLAWCRSNSGLKTHAVGQLQSNPFGLYDMHGNVWEWCADWHADDYYKISTVNDPRGPASGERRVLRGGSWRFGPGSSRSAHRNSGVPDKQRGYNLGFRVAAGLSADLLSKKSPARNANQASPSR